MKLLEIGIVRHEFSDDYVRDHPREIDGIIEIFLEFFGGIAGLREQSSIFAISIMHKHLNEKYPLIVKPRLLLRKGYREEDLPQIGVFASDSPSRPNPIGLTLLRINRIEGNCLYVSGLDLFNGTPVVDIKPYRERYRSEIETSNGEKDVCP